MSVVVKVFERPDAAARVFRLTDFPCTVGRSVASGITVRNPSVELEVGRLDWKDGLVLTDANGERKLVNGEVLTFGDARIEFYLDERNPIESPTGVGAPAPRKKGLWLAEIAFHFACFFGVVGVYLLCFWLNDHDADWEGRVSEAFFTILTVYVFAFMVSLFSKLHSGEYRYLKLLGVSVLGTIVLVAFSYLGDHVLFNLGRETIGAIVEAGFYFLFFCGFGYLAARVVFDEVSKWRLRVIAGAATGGLFFVFFVLAIITDTASQGFSFHGRIGYPLLAPVGESKTLDGFLEKIDDGAETLKLLRVKRLKEMADER